MVYQLKGVKHEDERHFNLQPLITALRTYVENYNDWTEKERVLHWCTVVGLAQTLIPAHIRHHYCDPEEGFWNNPCLKKLKLTRSLEIYSWVLSKSQLWSEGLSYLGLDFGVYSRLGRTGVIWKLVTAPHPRLGPAGNFAALMALDVMRTEIDLPALIKRLHTPIQNLEDDLDLQRIEL